MAKDKNKKKKKVSKSKVSMLLIQNMLETSGLSSEDKERFYQNFRVRAKLKSEHNYVDLGETPEMLRLYLIGTYFNSTLEFLVKVGSFKPIMSKSGEAKDQEIGFQVKLKSPLTLGKTHTLKVMRKQHKATLYITL